MTRPINIAVLGATGSIGRQTLDVIDRNPARFKMFGLTGGVGSSDRKAEHDIHGRAGEGDFDARVEAMVTDPRCDLVVVAIPGARALAPTLAALRAGKEVALATKEVLVMAGELVMRAAGERGIRPIVLNRKNALFAGHDQGAENWACIASLIETCKLHGVDPQANFTDVLTKLVNLWPASRLDELMPWAWAAERTTKKLAA